MAQAPFYETLRGSFRANYSMKDDDLVDVVYLTVCFVKRNGAPALHPCLFADFLNDDQRYLILLAPRTGRVVADLKSSNAAELQWNMPNTSEIWHFFGKLYTVASPTIFHRYTPPKVFGNIEARIYWEMERRKQWTRLTPSLRAAFTWPPEGAAPKSDPSTFACQELQCGFSFDNSTPDRPPPPSSSVGTGSQLLNAEQHNANLIRQMAFQFDRGDSPVRQGIPLPGEKKKTPTASTVTSPTTTVASGASSPEDGSTVSPNNTQMHPVPQENGTTTTVTETVNATSPKPPKRANTTGDMSKNSSMTVSSNSLDLIITGSNLHDGAFDNFCLLVFRSHRVEHLNYGKTPYCRMMYSLSSEKEIGLWHIEELNP